MEQGNNQDSMNIENPTERPQEYEMSKQPEREEQSDFSSESEFASIREDDFYQGGEASSKISDSDKKFILTLIGVVAGILLVFLICCIAGAVLVSKIIFQDNTHTVETQSIPVQSVVIETEFLGYTRADFEEVIFNEAEREMNLVVYTQELEDSQTTSSTWTNGLADGLSAVLSEEMLDKLREKTTTEQRVTYHGYASYQVDLGQIHTWDIAVDNDAKTVTITIPHAELRQIDIPSEEIEFGDVELGSFLANDSIEISIEESTRLESAAKTNMEAKLKEEDAAGQADAAAIDIVEDLFAPVIHQVADDYSVEIVFDKD